MFRDRLWMVIEARAQNLTFTPRARVLLRAHIDNAIAAVFNIRALASPRVARVLERRLWRLVDAMADVVGGLGTTVVDARSFRAALDRVYPIWSHAGRLCAGADPDM